LPAGSRLPGRESMYVQGGSYGREIA
jgi:hypothetical protein